MTWSPPDTSKRSLTEAEHYPADNHIKKQHTIADLQAMYTEADSVDQAIYAEMRSNLLLVAGEHYQKREALFFRRIRDAKELNQEQKLRLTKNHIRKICQTYANNIMSMNPGVGFTPKDEKSPHDQKVAEHHHSVWRDAHERYNLDDAMDDWCDNFIQVGEVIVKIFFDPMQGPLKGYRQATDEQGQPAFDEMGQPAPDMDSPVHQGEFVFEEVYGFNLLRPVECRDMRKAEWIGIRKMVNREDLLLKYKGDPEKEKMIHASVDDTYKVFDAAYGGFYKSNNQVSVREYFFRPSLKYPKGYYYISTREGILNEGELPGGFFPIVFQAFDKIQTTPRGRGPIKQMRPFQAEINRSSSKQAEHQVTLGDDKLLIQNGTKVSASAALPGIRSFTYTGAVPTIMEGRSGAQYLEYNLSQITELYSIMNVAEDSEESTVNMDPYVLLYRSGRQKKKFQRYIKRFEKFLIEVVKLYLKLAKIFLDDEALVWAVGKNEQVNIAEFKMLPDTCYEINLEAQSDDIETKLGKQIVLNHALQYVGQQLKPEDIGKIMRAMPFANFEESFDDLTIDFDNSQNDILALDRGQQPPVNEYDNHLYIIKKLTSRTKKADFKFLPPQVQQNYQAKIQLHQQIQAQQVAALQRAEQGFIPTSGYLVALDFYVSDPSDKTGMKTRRARLPYSAVEWLIGQLESQGQMQAQLSDVSQGNQAEMAGIVTQGAKRGLPPPRSEGPPQANNQFGPQVSGQGVLNASRNAGPGNFRV